ncbi:hypothetical protein [Nonomuraea recticatena]|uniref:Uncharacterized protein n=1 Tax=Nonomuraea recticatena TaxID=46178 RepID=A0ABN3SV16_9ACTN
MSTISAHGLYFDWKTIQHQPGCSRGWVAREHTTESPDGDLRTAVLQLVCPLPGGCGKVVEARHDEEPGTQPMSGAQRDRWRTVQTTVDEIGYGSAPIRVTGVWLHPGAPLVLGYDEGPAYYLVTRSPERPAHWGDVLGIIGQARNRGRQVKKHWHVATNFEFRTSAANFGFGSSAFNSPSPRDTEVDLPSRTAAVRWVIEHTDGGDRD